MAVGQTALQPPVGKLLGIGLSRSPTRSEQEIVIANMLTADIVAYVRSNWNRAWIALIPLLAVLATGCGGLVASPSISPAMFFLPGLGQNTANPSPVDQTEGHQPVQPL